MGGLELKNPEDPIFDSEDQEQKPEWDMSRILTLVAGVLILCGVVVPAWLGFHFSSVLLDVQSELDGVNSEIQILDIQIKKEREKNEQNFEARAKKIEELLSPSKRVLWSEVITELNRVTKATTESSPVDGIFSYSSFSANADGTLSINGYTNSYSAIADLIEGLEASPLFQNVRFSSSSKSKENIVSLSLSFKREEPKAEEEAPDDTAA